MKKYFLSYCLLLLTISLKSQQRSYIIKLNKDTLYLEDSYITDSYTSVKVKLNGKFRSYYADSIIKYNSSGTEYHSVAYKKKWALCLLIESGELMLYMFPPKDFQYVKTESQGRDEIIACFTKDLKKFTNLKCQSLLDSLRQEAHWDMPVTDVIKKYNKTCSERQK